MSFFCKVDKSTTGFLLHKIATGQLPVALTSTGRPCHRSHDVRQASQRQLVNRFAVAELERWFIAALSNASHCAHHASPTIWEPPKLVHRKPRPEGLRWLSFGARRRIQLGIAPPIIKPATAEQLLDLVDGYEEFPIPSYIKDPLEPPPGPHLAVSDKIEDAEWPPTEQIHPLGDEATNTVVELETVLTNLYHDPEHSYQLYRTLPSPRVSYLSSRTRHRLLRNLGAVERKDEHSMMRYLSVVDDMKVSAIALSTAEWNMATSFAGRYVARTTEVEVEAALRTFKEMEQVMGVQANAATFNILFDVATKAGKFNLGEMIYKEMSKRDFKFNRFHHVSMIHYQGLRGDGESVRRAYRALIEAGEIVDTTVLNCMISSLIRAGEPQSALEVYEKMKKLHSEKTNAVLPSKDYHNRRTVTKALQKMALSGSTDPIRLELFRNEAIIAPDIRTYRIIINYVAKVEGDLHNTVRLLEEMRWYHVQPHGTIFLAVFKGFQVHGGVRYSHWTDVRLESVWKAFMQCVDSGQTDQLYLGRWVIIWALRAFLKCCGKARTEAVWEEIRMKWTTAQADDLDFVRDDVLLLLATREDDGNLLPAPAVSWSSLV